jgi:hypothetical protein
MRKSASGMQKVNLRCWLRPPSGASVLEGTTERVGRQKLVLRLDAASPDGWILNSDGIVTVDIELPVDPEFPQRHLRCRGGVERVVRLAARPATVTIRVDAMSFRNVEGAKGKPARARKAPSNVWPFDLLAKERTNGRVG